jgi:hypothetical protein
MRALMSLAQPFEQQNRPGEAQNAQAEMAALMQALTSDRGLPPLQSSQQNQDNVS